MRLPMMLYTAAINGAFAFLIAGGLLFTKNGLYTHMVNLQTAGRNWTLGNA